MKTQFFFIFSSVSHNKISFTKILYLCNQINQPYFDKLSNHGRADSTDRKC